MPDSFLKSLFRDVSHFTDEASEAVDDEVSDESLEFPDGVDSKLKFLIPVALGKEEKKGGSRGFTPSPNILRRMLNVLPLNWLLQLVGREASRSHQWGYARRPQAVFLGLRLSPKLRSTGVCGSYRRGNSNRQMQASIIRIIKARYTIA